MPDFRFVTIQEAADLLRVSSSTIRRAIRSGRLRAVRLQARTVRVDLASISPVFAVHVGGAA